MVSWMVEHAADARSKYQVGAGGRTGYEGVKRQARAHALVEFGAPIEYKFPKGTKRRGEKLNGTWGEGDFLEKCWRTGGTIIGSPGGVRRARTIRRVGHTGDGMQTDVRASEEFH